VSAGLKAEGDQTGAGLCESCVHSRKIVSDRGSIFWQCLLALTDPRFSKYPQLPVLLCSGYVAKSAES
jgi:hypothetical protein